MNFKYSVTVVQPVLDEGDYDRIMAELEQIAYEILKSGDTDGLCEVDAS
jgi:hypothetical protein